MHLSRRCALAVGACAVWTAVIATPAFAHAGLIGATPAPNIGVGQTPGVVRLRFSEPLRVPPSAVRVLDRSGRDHVVGIRRIATDPQSMEATLGSIAPGVYRVEWKSVSTVDGHTIRGAYEFGVGEAPSGAPPTSEAGPLAGAGVAGIALRVVQDAALLLLVGIAGAALLARGAVPRLAHGAARMAALLAPVAAAGAFATVAAEGVAAAGFSARGLGLYLSGSVAGWSRASLLVLSLVAVVAARAGRLGAVLGAAAAALSAVAVSGHAAATSWPIASMASNAAHLVFAGLWVGGAAALALGRRMHGLRREEIVRVTGRASPFAIASAALVAATGSVNAIGQLTALSDLWRSSYGALVSAKIFALFGIAGLGAWHSFVLRPRLESRGTVSRTDSVVEAATAEPTERGILTALSRQRWLGLLAIVAAAVLVAFPDPPAQQARAERQARTPPAVFAAGEGPLVTVADRSGPLLVALTIAPPAPGDVAVTVQLTDSRRRSTDGWRVTVVGDGPQGSSIRTPLSPCGPGCFEGATRLASRGLWTFRVRARDHEATFRISLPTPDGTAVLRRARESWRALEAVRLIEILDNGLGRIFRTEYLLEAPDRMHLRTNAGREEIVVGTRDFERKAPGMPWRETPYGSVRFPWPGQWRSASAARLLADTVVEGRPAWNLAFFDPEAGIWYRLEVDKESGRALRQHMTIAGHFMVHIYSQFDEPFGIGPPV